MTEIEFVEYTDDPDIASELQGHYDIMVWHLGYDKVKKEMIKFNNLKMLEALDFIINNKIPINYLFYKHLVDAKIKID